MEGRIKFCSQSEKTIAYWFMIYEIILILYTSYKLLLKCYSILFEHIHLVEPIRNLLLIVRVHGYHWPQKYKIYPKCLSTNIPYSPSLFIIKHVLENWNSAEEEPIYTYTPSCHVTGWFELRFLLLWYILIYFVFILWS